MSSLREKCLKNTLKTITRKKAYVRGSIHTLPKFLCIYNSFTRYSVNPKNLTLQRFAKSIFFLSFSENYQNYFKANYDVITLGMSS